MPATASFIALRPRTVPTPGSSRAVRGNILVLTLLALLIMAALASAYWQRQRIDFSLAQGQALADEMKTIQLAVNKAIFNSHSDLQAGHPLHFKMNNPTTGAPMADKISPVIIDAIDGRPSWNLTLAELREAGLLPASFLPSEQSSVANGTYKIYFFRTGENCPAVNPVTNALVFTSCLIDGAVVLDEPLGTKTDTGTYEPNPFMYAAFNTKAGPDGGQSHLNKLPWFLNFLMGYSTKAKNYTLGGKATSIKGNFDSVAFALPNKTDHDVPGLAALRVGSYNFHLDELVRMDEDRNIKFNAHLNVGKNLSIGQDLKIGGDLPQNPRLGNPEPGQEGEPCASLTQYGNLNLACQGQLSLVVAQEGAPCQTPEPVRQIKTGEPKQSAARYGALPDGALATCLLNPGATQGAPNSGHWVPLQRFRAAGSPCGSGLESEGSAATDPQDHQNLICKNNRYLRTSALTSNLVLKDTRKLTIVVGNPEFDGVIDKPECADTGQGHVGQPRIFVDSLEENSLGLYPKNAMVSGVERFVEEISDSKWKVRLIHSIDKTPINGTVTASIFCVYP